MVAEEAGQLLLGLGCLADDQGGDEAVAVEVVADQPFLERSARDQLVVPSVEVTEEPDLGAEDLGEEVGDLIVGRGFAGE